MLRTTEDRVRSMTTNDDGARQKKCFWSGFWSGDHIFNLKFTRVRAGCCNPNLLWAHSLNLSVSIVGVSAGVNDTVLALYIHC